MEGDCGEEGEGSGRGGSEVVEGRGGEGEGSKAGEAVGVLLGDGVGGGGLLVWPKKNLLVVVAVGVDVFSFLPEEF